MLFFYIKNKYAKEVLIKQKSVDTSKEHRSKPERAPTGESYNLRNKVDSVVLGYNPKCKINIHEFIMI